MKLNFTYILLFCLLTASSLYSQKDSVTVGDYTAPKEYIIGGIEVSGAAFTDKNVIKLLSGLVVGDKIKIPGDRITDAVKALW